ncbi:MAG: hypothetical protein ISS94_02210 [Candidatus Syntrophoarchaeum sp.]|nr:hypothetical protein [Methanomicrobia archaeon]MBL7117584.1 hypothetical protein [Candidatus Syntrophoarchaeum sp.]
MEYEMEMVREEEREVERIAELPDEEKREIGDELLEVVVEKGVELNPREVSEFMALIKGHHTKDIFRKVIKTAMRINPSKTTEILRGY